MQISAPALKPVPLPDLSGVATPKFDWNNTVSPERTISVTYRDPATGERMTRTAGPRFGDFGDSCDVKGTFLEAVKAAQSFAAFGEDTGNNEKWLSSTSIFQAKEGVYTLVRNMFLEGMGDGMEPRISMPIDPVVDSEVGNSIPWTGKNAPTATVRINNPDILAVVGQNVWVQPRLTQPASK